MFDIIKAEVITPPYDVICPHCNKHCFEIEELEELQAFERIILQDCLTCHKAVKVYLRQVMDEDKYTYVEAYTTECLTEADKSYLTSFSQTEKQPEQQPLRFPLRLTELSKEASDVYWAEGNKIDHCSHDQLMRAVIIMLCTKFNLEIDGVVQ